MPKLMSGRFLFPVSIVSRIVFQFLDSFVVRYIGLHCDLIQNNIRTYLTKMHMQKKKTKMGFRLKKT